MMARRPAPGLSARLSPLFPIIPFPSPQALPGVSGSVSQSGVLPPDVHARRPGRGPESVFNFGQLTVLHPNCQEWGLSSPPIMAYWPGSTIRSVF